MDEEQERRVALGLRAGNADAWRTLYDAYAERVWRAVARRLGPSPADIADVVQETFLAAARSARTYDPERGPLWAWLWGVARLHVALHYRKQHQQERLQQARARLGPAAEAPRDALDRAELAELVRATLAELPGDYETLLTAKYLDGEPVDQIAERERLSGVAVRSKLARARQAFLKHVPPTDRPVGTHP
jgi:RNA polymerase sigma-70 factor (ECF subfamily)